MTTKKCSMLNCKKKLKLTDEIPCRCGSFFCQIHRFSTKHDCSFDYKKEQQEHIKRTNPKIEIDKLERI